MGNKFYAFANIVPVGSDGIIYIWIGITTCL